MKNIVVDDMFLTADMPTTTLTAEDFETEETEDASARQQ